MMVVTIIMFLITLTIAKHHHSDLGPNDDFFGSVYLRIHTVMNDLFESVNIGTNFTNQLNTKLLLTMHHDLKNIANVAIDTYNVIQEIINENNSNQSDYMYSFNKTEEVINLDNVVTEILNNNNFDVYKAIKGKHKHVKHKREDKEKNRKTIKPAFENSEEFTEFVIHFLAKVNNLTIQDFKKSAKYGRPAVSSTKNLKAWEAPSSLIFDLEEGDTRRIFGGSKASVKSFPFIVSIHIMGEFTCSGCIISRDLVITAASCLGVAYKNDSFEKNLKSIYVRIGSDHTTRGGETIPVQNLYFHPEFSPKNFQNNLAIIRLEQRIRFSRKQKKIRRILWDNTEGGLSNETREILVLGWGATKKDQVTQNHQKLRVSMIDVYNITDCKKKHTEDFIAKENFCAAFNGTNGSACNGDVGGPGIVGRTLMGVISFDAPDCGAAGAPTVFTKLGYYRTWIDSILNTNNKTNNESVETRRKIKYLNKKRVPSSDMLNDHDKEYPDEEIALRDTLIQLVRDDQSVVHDIIYGEMYDEFSQFFKLAEEMKGGRTSYEDEMAPTPLFEFKLGLQTVRKPRPTESYTKTPMHTTAFKPRPGETDCEIDNDAIQNDYSDNYEKSSDEKQGLSIEAPPAVKLSLRNKEYGPERWSSNSDSDAIQQNSEESIDYSEEIKEFFAKNREYSKNKDADKMRDSGDDTRLLLGNGKGKENPKLIKRDKLSKHASSVLDEAKNLATKTFLIDFEKTDMQVNINKHKRKHTKNKATTEKSKVLKSNKTVSKSFFLQF